MTRRGYWAIALSVTVCALLWNPIPAHSHGTEKGSLFVEFTNSHGNSAHWADVNWGSIPCGASGSTHFVDTVISVVGDPQSAGGNAFVELGYEKQKQGGSCVVLDFYFWSRYYNNTINFDTIQSPTPRGEHDFALNRLSSDCASGISWCWHVRIDGVTKHTTAGEETELDVALENHVFTVCNIHPNDCEASGLVDPASPLKYKPTDFGGGTWPNWSGQDAECSDYGAKARAKWVSGDSVKMGFNVTLSGAIQNDPCP